MPLSMPITRLVTTNPFPLSFGSPPMAISDALKVMLVIWFF